MDKNRKAMNDLCSHVEVCSLATSKPTDDRTKSIVAEGSVPMVVKRE